MGSLVAGLGLHHKGVLVLVHVIHGVPRPITADSKGQWVRAVPLESSLTKTVSNPGNINTEAGRQKYFQKGSEEERKKEREKRKKEGKK